MEKNQSKETTQMNPSAPGNLAREKNPGNEKSKFNPSDYLKKETEITEQDFYEVFDPRAGKKKVPSARVYNNWAKEAGIKTRILEAGCDSEKAWAHVKGWIGDETNPILQREARVTILWKTELEDLVWNAIADKKNRSGEIIKKGKRYTIGPDSYPILSSLVDQLAIIQQLSRIKRFGERTAVTKAEAIVEKKLLGVEYREPEEIKHEKREVQSVSDLKKGAVDEETGEGSEALAGSVPSESISSIADPTTHEQNGDTNPMVNRETPIGPSSTLAETHHNENGSKKHSDLSILPPSAFPKRSLTKVVKMNGKAIRTAGIEAEQLSKIWKAAETYGNAKIAPLLKTFGVEKSTHLTKEEAEQLLSRLATLSLAETNGMTNLPV